MKNPDRCKTCIHWYNKQRYLNYDPNSGSCLNPKFRFNTVDGRLLGVIDMNNRKDQTKVTGNPAHDVESGEHLNVNFSQYLLATSEDFGCIFHKKS